MKKMKKRRLKWRSLSFTILSDDPQKKVTRFKVPRFFFPILALIIFITITITTYLSIHYFEESKKLALHNEQLISELNEEEQKSRQLITEVGALKEKELEVEQQLNMLYDLESQVKETMEDLPVSVEPSGGMAITISEEEAKLIHVEASELTTKASKLIQRYDNTLEVIRKQTKNYSLFLLNGQSLKIKSLPNSVCEKTHTHVYPPFIWELIFGVI